MGGGKCECGWAAIRGRIAVRQSVHLHCEAGAVNGVGASGCGAEAAGVAWVCNWLAVGSCVRRWGL